VDVDVMLKQHEDLLSSMFDEGFIDEQYSQLQMLQDESNPEFVEEVVTLFFTDSERLLENLTDCLKTNSINYKVVDGHVHQFKGSSSSIGAQRVKQVCITFRQCCDNKDKEGCLESLEKVKKEFSLVRGKLETLLELEKRIVAAGGTLPFLEEY
jgi:histidine-containing phosphotransfer protein